MSQTGAIIESAIQRKDPMAKPNYQYEKRQRELEKKRKKEHKAQRKTTGGPESGDAGADEQPAEPVADAQKDAAATD